MKYTYIPFGIHSVYSILSSSIRLESLIEKAKEYGYETLVLTDENFSSHLKFKSLARKNGIKPILGLDMNTSFGRFTIIPKNIKGYKNLVELNNLNETNELNFEKFVDLLDENVVIIERNDLLIKRIGSLKELDLYLMIHMDKIDDADYLTQRLKISKEYQIPTILYSDIRFLDDEEEKIFNVLKKIGDKNIKGSKLPSLDDVNELLKKFKGSHLEDAVKNTVKIAENVEDFDLSIHFELPKFSDNDAHLLRRKVHDGLKKLYGSSIPDNVKKRANRELDVILSKGLESYFLCVSKIVEVAKSMRIYVGPGRGSAVGSVVAYALGITRIDPIKYDLMFERFLNEYRTDFPDIDIDVQDDERQRLLEKLKDVFGRWNFLQIVTFGTMGEKLALREITRISELDKKTENKILSGKVKDHEIIKLAKKLIGIPHHISIHAAGVVISGVSLKNSIPVFSGDSIMISQFDMEDLESMNVVKIDILGLRTLSFLKEMMEEAGYSDLTRIPLDDEKTYEIFSKGLTTSVFQMETSLAKRISIMMKPRNITDLSILIALNRPGPIQSNLVSEFLKIRKGKKSDDATYFSEMLCETNGIPIFQEQIMKLSMEISHLTPTQADDFRRAISKKDMSKMKAYKEKFINGLIEKGLDEKKSEEIFNSILSFSNYAFNKSHSTAYSHISYWSAYFKANHPELFFKTAFNYNVNDREKLFELSAEMGLFGLKLSNPDINESEVQTKVSKNTLIPGFGFIKGIGRSTGSIILKEREKFGKFRDLKDAVNRLKEHLSFEQMRNLILSGAFDSLDPEISNSRFETVEKIRKMYEGKMDDLGEIQATLFGSEIRKEKSEKKVKKAKKEEVFENIKHELEILGFSPSIFKLDFKEVKTISVLEGFLGNKGFTKVKVLKAGDEKILYDGTTMVKNEVSEVLKEGSYIMIFSETLESIFNLNEVDLILKFEVIIPEDSKDDEINSVISNLEESKNSVTTLKIGKYRINVFGFKPKDEIDFSINIWKVYVKDDTKIVGSEKE